MLNSLFIDKLNRFGMRCQSFLYKKLGDSCLVKNIDDAVFALLTALLIFSTFWDSDKIAIFAILIILVNIFKFFFKRGERIELINADGALIAFFALMVVSTINSTLLIPSIVGLLKHVIYIGYYFAILPFFKKNPKKLLPTILIIAGLCSWESFYALLQTNQVLEGATWQDMSYINPEDAISRVFGTLKPYNPNLLAGYLIACLPSVLGVALLTVEKRHRKSFLIALVSFLVVTAAIFQTGCRGAYLALIAIILGLIVISYRIVFYDFSAFKNIQAWWKRLVGAVVAAGVAALCFMPKILNRIMSIFLLRGDSSTSFRMNVYQASWQMFTDNFLLGIGIGNQTFREVYGYYMKTGFDALGAYSVPLEIAVETGVLGFLAFFTFIGLLFYNSAKYLSQNQSIRGKIYVSICILSVLGVMAHGIFDTIFFRPQVQFVFWTFVAILNTVLYKKEVEL